MATKGSVPLNAVMPVNEVVTTGNPSLAYANGGYGDDEYGRYTMPFTGSLTFRLDMTVNFTGYQQVTLSNVGFTSPTPSADLNMTNLDGSPGWDYLVAHHQMAWNSLAAGQLVIVNLRLSVGGGGSSVGTDWRSIMFRAVRA